MKNNIIIVLVIVIAVLVIIQSFQLRSLKEKIATISATGISGAAVSGLDMSGWTEDEKMMYEHHGTLPARVQGKAQSTAGPTPTKALPTMVGGC